MAVTVFDPNVTGKNLYTGLTQFRKKDNAGDNFVSGSYSHINIEWSATEATEWVSYFMYLNLLIASIQATVTKMNTTVGPKQIAQGGAVAAWGAQSLWNWQNFQ